MTELITECFSTDEDLINKWHIVAGTGLTNCVKRTVTDLETAKVVVHRLEYNGILAGFFGTEFYNSSNFLTSFFIKPEFRTKAFIDYFWERVTAAFCSTNFYCGVYKKNLPAKQFLLRAGGELLREVQIDNEEGLIFIFNKR